MSPDNLPELPPEMWQNLLEAALAAGGNSLGAWLRLRAVCRSWRRALTGTPVNLSCSAPLTPAQWQWLRTAGAKFRTIRFHPDDKSTTQLLLDDAILAASEESLEIVSGLELVKRPWNGAAVSCGSLSRFEALQSLSLRRADYHNLDAQPPPLPTGLRDLVLEADPKEYCAAPMQLDLRYLTDLTRLTLQGHSNHTSGFNAHEGIEAHILPPRLKMLRIEAAWVDLSDFNHWPRMDALPALEVVAERVSWDWVLHPFHAAPGDVNGADTLAAGFSDISIRTSCLRVCRDVEPHGHVPGAPNEVSAAGTFVDILRFAPSTLRACSLGPASLSQSATQRCILEVEIDYIHRYENAPEHPGAAKLAEALQPYAEAANIGLQLDEESQVVCLTRVSAA